MFNSDGLPMWYVNALENKTLMREMKQGVFDRLDCFGKDSASEICSMLDIDPIFEPEVEEFIAYWERA